MGAVEPSMIQFSESFLITKGLITKDFFTIAHHTCSLTVMLCSEIVSILVTSTEDKQFTTAVFVVVVISL